MLFKVITLSLQYKNKVKPFKRFKIMKYRVTTTTADHVNGHTYSSARAALTVYNNIRALYSRLGYTLADAGKGHNERTELWIKEGRADRNIEIWPVIVTAPEEPAPAIIESKRESRTARVLAAVCARLATLWAILSDYAAGTYIYTIKPAAAKFGRKVAKVITCAALYIFRVVWFGAILCATLATLAGLASYIADYVPAFFLLRLAAFFGCAAVAALVEIALIYISKIIDRATDRRLFAMPK